MRANMFKNNRDTRILEDELNAFIKQRKKPFSFSEPDKYEWLLSNWNDEKWVLKSNNNTKARINFSTFRKMRIPRRFF